jgi:UrcA family protein
MRFTLPILALAAIAAPAATAQQADADIVTVRIAVADLDLATEAGRAKLEKRLEARLRKICTIEAKSRFAYGRDIVDEACVAEARTAALAEAERMVAARARTGGDVAAN